MNLSDLLPAFSAFFKQHQLLGVMFAGSISFIESLAIIGSIVPGSIVMTIVGFLLGVGAIPIKGTIISIFIGAFVGDFISYGIGAYYKDSIKNHRWVQPYEHWLMHGEAFMRKHGTLSIIIGRFVGPMRSMVPMIAGIANMNLVLFTLAILPTIVLWSIVYLTPGVLLGALSIDMGESLFAYFLSKSLLFVVIISLWFSLHSIVRVLHPLLKRKTTLNIDADSLTSLLKAIILLCSASYLAYATLSQSETIISLNRAVYHLSLLYSSASNINLAHNLSMTFGPESYLLINIAICIVFYYHRYTKLAGIWILGAMGLFVLVAGFKYLLSVPRPHPLLTSSSFPSGHTLLTPTLLLGLSLLAEAHSRPIGITLRRVSMVLIIMVSIARLLLQAHWISDILFSLSISFALGHLMYTARRLIPTMPHGHIKQVGAATTLILLPFATLTPYMPGPVLPILPEPITVNTKSDLKKLPTLRYSRIGSPQAPLNFVFVGDKPQLDNYFNQQGWKMYPNSGKLSKRLATLFKFREYQDILPILPPLLNNHGPDAIYGYVTDENAYIAKLWRVEGKLSTYVGTISKETYPESFFSSKLFVCQRERFNINPILDEGTYRVISHQPYTQSNSIDAFCWNGKTALIRP